MNYKECTTIKSGKKITVGENNKKLFIINKSKVDVEKIKVDGCLIKNDKEKKCDYIVCYEKKSQQKVYYVEFKGSKVKTGFIQLENTIIKTMKRFREYEKKCLVISSRVPKISTEIQRNKKKFKRDFKAELKIVNNQHTISI